MRTTTPPANPIRDLIEELRAEQDENARLRRKLRRLFVLFRDYRDSIQTDLEEDPAETAEALVSRYERNVN